ncbi:hypothetical protein QJV14_06070 [Listeria cossartiae subsp. cayugensis]|uniref:Uncharacterized protein n=1 Tax=Listeria cossartiae subsp. cayugensis TaxID=2713505 RepID=A0ABU2IMZ9_9LIST|nr:MULTISPECIES: hypothetical protein [Listeria]MDT0002122.1 hypothetical protein [Listeria cossartiae subsp. cayugensis]MDT0014066.1 hypothetical protein [Listeria cossartiae subsp. cayugensis]MDT0019509.1 hypothetical protein [Listeria cossartiae subsp. cayugensis]MDT0034917.1 hypothetical protein [Listeria cossartiae subsp. cayugensis]MDT0041260.1 hypothetical protein [Listeria cossartiae subsp. cayugensis]
MYLKEVRLYSDEDVSNIPFSETFHIQAEAITDLFSSLLGKIRTENVSVININCAIKENMENPMIISTFLDVFIEYDVSKFNKLNEFEKEQQLVRLLQNGLEKATGILALDKRIFEQVFKAMEERNFKNHFIWKKPKSSPDRKLRAYVEINWGIEKTEAYILIEDRKKQVKLKEKMALKHPGRMGLDILGELTWLNNDTVELRHKYIKNEVHTFSISANEGYMVEAYRGKTY